ncbi:hypothetical protein PPYR_11435 [Photinus pyralis]|uniref:Uncharacterized protein n=1 Tax=Photinus pyralis TaxID=7054 RepID=A0A5N4AB88_PHOPY|nr:hypothetical protein PPYR_11435 [Photinus pyralis]
MYLSVSAATCICTGSVCGQLTIGMYSRKFCDMKCYAGSERTLVTYGFGSVVKVLKGKFTDETEIGEVKTKDKPSLRIDVCVKKTRTTRENYPLLCDFKH